MRQPKCKDCRYRVKAFCTHPHYADTGPTLPAWSHVWFTGNATPELRGKAGGFGDGCNGRYFAPNIIDSITNEPHNLKNIGMFVERSL